MGSTLGCFPTNKVGSELIRHIELTPLKRDVRVLSTEEGKKRKRKKKKILRKLLETTFDNEEKMEKEYDIEGTLGREFIVDIERTHGREFILGLKKKKKRKKRKREEEEHEEDEIMDDECLERSTPSNKDLLTEKEEVLPDFYKWLTDKYKNVRVVRLYIGKKYPRYYGSSKEVIVVVIDGFTVIKEDVYKHRRNAFPIICKLWKFLSIEDVATNPDPEPFPYSKFASEVDTCIQSLFDKHSNLESVSASYRLRDSREEITDLPELCIVLYCSCKGVVPLNEKEFPKAIEGIRTVVREGFFHLYGNDIFFKRSTDVLNPLMMGASISKKGDDKGGTLGGFVTMDNGDIGFITCAHVLFDLPGQCNPSAKFDVVQPAYGYMNTNRVCGTHAKSCFPTSSSNTSGCTIDATLVKLTDRIPERGLFADLTIDNLKENGYSMENLPEFSAANIRDTEEAGRLMLPCVKWGAKTGFTRGMLRLEGAAVRWTNESINLGNPSSQHSFIYNKQLEVQGIGGTSFALPGDSGALVFQIDPAKKEDEDHQLHCIGMVIGGTSAGKTVVTPIKPILKALNVKMHKFSPEKMDES